MTNLDMSLFPEVNMKTTKTAVAKTTALATRTLSLIAGISRGVR